MCKFISRPLRKLEQVQNKLLKPIGINSNIFGGKLIKGAVDAGGQVMLKRWLLKLTKSWQKKSAKLQKILYSKLQLKDLEADRVAVVLCCALSLVVALDFITGFNYDR